MKYILLYETSDFKMSAQMVFICLVLWVFVFVFCFLLFAFLDSDGPDRARPTSPFGEAHETRFLSHDSYVGVGPETHTAIYHATLLPSATPHSLLSPGDAGIRSPRSRHTLLMKGVNSWAGDQNMSPFSQMPCCALVPARLKA